jgi:PBSX family phage terminase large subunit
MIKGRQVDLSQWQSNVWFDDHRYVVINCGRQAGKSTVMAYKMVDFAAKGKEIIIEGKKTIAPVKVWYVAPTYRQAKNILWEMLMAIIPKEAIKRKNETELKITLINDSTIECKGAEEPDNLRGVGIDLCVFDECAFIKAWEQAWTVMRPILFASKAKCYFISTPNGLQNHFKHLAYNEIIDGKEVRLMFDSKLHSYHHYTSYDNPYLEKAELDSAKIEMTEDAFAQEIMGEFRKMSGLIYKDFKREIHMVDVPHMDSNWTYTRAIDFGFAHKTALIYFGINPDMTEIYAYDGLYVSNFTESQIADVIKVKDAGKHITNPRADSAQPMTIAGLSNAGAYFIPVEKAKDSVKNGIIKVAEMLRIRRDTGKPTLMFSKHLTWIADEFEKYRWIENKNDRSLVKEIPYKVQDDSMDAIRYMVMSLQSQDDDLEVPPEREINTQWY